MQEANNVAYGEMKIYSEKNGMYIHRAQIDYWGKGYWGTSPCHSNTFLKSPREMTREFKNAIILSQRLIRSL